jgi:hypothetical protein
MAVLRALSTEKSETHRRWFIGREVDAITLHTPPDIEAVGRTTALTENFLPAEIEARMPANEVVRLRVTGLEADHTLIAVLCS